MTARRLALAWSWGSVCGLVVGWLYGSAVRDLTAFRALRRPGSGPGATLPPPGHSETAEPLIPAQRDDETGKRLAYIEYGADRRGCLRADCAHVVGTEGCVLDDRSLWWDANCALWCGRITEESLADQRNSMPPDEFRRSR